MRWLFDGVALPGEEVLGERVQDVGAEDAVVLDLAVGVGVAHDGDVHVDDLELVRLGYLQRRLQHVEELAERLVRHVLRSVRVELLPDLVEEVVVLVRDALLHVLRGLGVVLQDDGDVHVDNDEEAEDEVEDHECHPSHLLAAVALVAGLWVWLVAFSVVSDGLEGVRPTGGSAHL